MEHLPHYIGIVFIITTIITFWLLYRAAHYSKIVIVISLLWLTAQAVISLTGFYTVTTGVPPRFMLLLMPPTIFIVLVFLIKRGRVAIDSFDAKTLTLLHIVRIPVELTLFGLYLHKVIPEVMTFEGRNFDILCGLSAPFVYYFGYIKNILSPKILIAWNVICLLLLANIVVTAVLSGPFAFQKFAFNQSDFALLYFPFVWLPGYVVPIVLFAHLTAIRQLMKSNKPVLAIDPQRNAY
jgi:hypothetical protein